MSKEKKLYLVSPRGFCRGVKDAIDIVDEVLEKYPPPIYIYNEIVHNKTIVEDLAKKGVTFIKHIDEIPLKQTLVFSAHGVSPQVVDRAKVNECTIIDATCPLVQKVHDKVHYYTSEGCYILYIGHRNHEEVIGVYEENPGNISIIDTEDDILDIPLDKEKYAILSQTTLNVDLIAELISKIKERVPNSVNEKMANLCYATTTRQEAIHEVAKNVDLFFVIGSQNSSNSKRLKEIASQYSKAYLIDNYHEIDTNVLSKATSVGLSSGASAPEYLISETIDYLIDHHHYSLIEVKKGTSL